jgi:SAM-dependent methyltransferase
MQQDVTTTPSIGLTDSMLNLRAWRTPDMLFYRHREDEWWVAPLEDQIPLIRLNPAGAELLAAMDGNVTLGTLLERYGGRVCGHDGETGRWQLERWALPEYSLCYLGAEAPTTDRTGARWDLLLQKIRETWAANAPSEHEAHLPEFHLNDILTQEGHFDTIETTVSHLFREPSEALEGLTYGRRLAHQFRRMGWLTPRPRVVLEVGGGLGYVAKEFAAELAPHERIGLRYVFLDLTRPFLRSQIKLAGEAGLVRSGVHANAESLPLANHSVDLVIDNENLADMTPVKLTRGEIQSHKGDTPLHQEAIDWIRRTRLPLEQHLPDELIFNLGPFRFVSELWRVLRPGGKAFLVEFGIETGWPIPVKLPGHTEYEVQYSHLRHAARWLGFQEQLMALPQFFSMKPSTKVLCTGAAYAIQRFCRAVGRSFSIRAYTERELSEALGDMLPKLSGYHYHDISDPAWFGLWDFKVLLLQKPGGPPRPTITETKGFRWYSQR